MGKNLFISTQVEDSCVHFFLKEHTKVKKRLWQNEMVKYSLKEKKYQYPLPVSVRDVLHADEEELTAKS